MEKIELYNELAAIGTGVIIILCVGGAALVLRLLGWI